MELPLFVFDGFTHVCVLWFVVHHSRLCYLIYFVLLLALCASFNLSQLNQLNPRLKNFFTLSLPSFLCTWGLEDFFNFNFKHILQNVNGETSNFKH